MKGRIMEQKIYRQGDTLLREISQLPQDIVSIPKDNLNRVVIAHGEMTGHAHAFRESEVTGFVMETANKDISRTDGCPHFIEIGGSNAILNHEHITGKKAEHDAIIIPAGIYESAVQVEEMASSLTQVAD